MNVKPARHRIPDSPPWPSAQGGPFDTPGRCWRQVSCPILPPTPAKWWLDRAGRCSRKPVIVRITTNALLGLCCTGRLLSAAPVGAPADSIVATLLGLNGRPRSLRQTCAAIATEPPQAQCAAVGVGWCSVNHPSPEYRSTTSIPCLTPTAARSGHSASHYPAVGMSVPWKNPGRLLLMFAPAELPLLDVARCPSLCATDTPQ